MTSSVVRSLSVLVAGVALAAPATSKAVELCWKLDPTVSTGPVLRAELIAVSSELVNVNARLRTNATQFLGSGTLTRSYPTTTGGVLDMGLHLVRGRVATGADSQTGRTCDFHARFANAFGSTGTWFVKCPATVDDPTAREADGDLALATCVAPALEAPTTGIPGLD